MLFERAQRRGHLKQEVPERNGARRKKPNQATDRAILSNGNTIFGQSV